MSSFDWVVMGALFAGAMYFVGESSDLVRVEPATLVNCHPSSQLTRSMRCSIPSGAGAHIKFRVNPAAQTVQMDSDRAALPGKNTILDACHVVDRGNWECALEGNNVHVGMKGGRVYTVAETPEGERFQSSITGLFGWAVDRHLIGLQKALDLDSDRQEGVPPTVRPVESPATVAEIEAHGGRWIGGKLFYKTCPRGAWGPVDRLPPLKDLCPPPTMDVPATKR